MCVRERERERERERKRERERVAKCALVSASESTFLRLQVRWSAIERESECLTSRVKKSENKSM